VQQVADAEERYEQAIRVGRDQKAKSLVLRAASDLGRLWAGRGATTQAAALLRPLCDSFAEGLTNQDLVDAKSLIKQCAEGFRCVTPEEPYQ
jgi:predicted ATPase